MRINPDKANIEGAEGFDRTRRRQSGLPGPRDVLYYSANGWRTGLSSNDFGTTMAGRELIR